MLINKLIRITIFLLFCVCTIAAQSPASQQNIIKPTPEQEGATTGNPTKISQQPPPQTTNQHNPPNEPIASTDKIKTPIDNRASNQPYDYQKENLKIQTNLSQSTTKIANFTIILAIATAFLVFVAIWQGYHLKRSVDSLCNAERAYIFAKVKRHPDSKPGQIIESIKEGYNQARIIATNHGKTPAIIIKANWYVGVFEDIEIDNKIAELEYIADSMVPPSIIINSGDTKKGLPMYDISIEERDKIDVTADYVCFGRIEYKDIFDKTHITIFCWRDNGTYFAPDPDPKRNKHT